MNNNLLSIDLDYIFEPCIQLYNEDIDIAPKARIWDRLYQVKDIKRHLSINEKSYNAFKTTFKQLKHYKNIKKIYLGENHSSIIKACADIGGKFNIINIDHHHDLGYSPFHDDDVYKYDICGAGNWVTYLNKYNKISQYIWIKNPNSEDYQGKPVNFDFYINTLNDDLEFYLCKVLNSIEYLYITTSDKWCPPTHRYYVDSLLDIIDVDIPIINYEYNVAFPDNAPHRYFN